MFEELHVLSVERQLYAGLYSCEKPAQVFSVLEQAIRQLLPFDGLYIHYKNQYNEDLEKFSGPKALEAKKTRESVAIDGGSGLPWFQFSFGEGHGFQGMLSLVVGRQPSPSILCSIERMVQFCSRSLYQYELLQRVANYAKEQELLLRELRHRTHNNLQFMLGTFPYLIATSEELSAEFKEQLEQRFQGLIVLSSIWDSQSIEATVSAPSYFISVVRTLRQLWIEGRGSLELSLQVDETLVLSKEMATSVALIVNELITNTLKHSQKMFPVIKLNIQQKEAQLLLDYKEIITGYSSAETVQEQAPHYQPAVNRGGEGRGIIKGLVSRVGGSILVETVPGDMAAYQFSAVFPIIPATRAL